MRCVFTSLEGSSCWRTSRVFGQLPPRRIWRAVARSLASSWGKWGTLGGRVRGVRSLFTFGWRGGRIGGRGVEEYGDVEREMGNW